MGRHRCWANKYMLSLRSWLVGLLWTPFTCRNSNSYTGRYYVIHTDTLYSSTIHANTKHTRLHTRKYTVYIHVNCIHNHTCIFINIPSTTNVYVLYIHACKYMSNMHTQTWMYRTWHVSSTWCQSFTFCPSCVLGWGLEGWYVRWDLELIFVFSSFNSWWLP